MKKKNDLSIRDIELAIRPIRDEFLSSVNYDLYQMSAEKQLALAKSKSKILLICETFKIHDIISDLNLTEYSNYCKFSIYHYLLDFRISIFFDGVNILMRSEGDFIKMENFNHCQWYNKKIDGEFDWKDFSVQLLNFIHFYTLEGKLSILYPKEEE